MSADRQPDPGTCLAKPYIKATGDVVYLVCAMCGTRERLGYAVLMRELYFAVDRHHGNGR